MPTAVLADRRTAVDDNLQVNDRRASALTLRADRPRR